MLSSLPSKSALTPPEDFLENKFLNSLETMSHLSNAHDLAAGVQVTATR